MVVPNVSFHTSLQLHAFCTRGFLCCKCLMLVIPLMCRYFVRAVSVYFILAVDCGQAECAFVYLTFQQL